MVMFRNTDEEILMTSISIRMSTVEFFDDCLFMSRQLDITQV